jgi:hypothetical protein
MLEGAKRIMGKRLDAATGFCNFETPAAQGVSFLNAEGLAR